MCGYFKSILSFFVSVLLGLHLFCQGQEIGIKYIKNYTPKDYNESPKNYCIVQGKQGVIYAANQGGLLEYDGVSWRLIPIPNLAVFSLATANDGTVYIGGYKEIGFLAPGSKGTLRYESLRDHLKDDQKRFSYVWKTFSTKEGVYFQTREYLFRWDGKHKQIKALTEKVNALFICREKLYIRRQGTGLLQMKNDSFELVPGGEIFAKKVIFMLVEYDSQHLLIGTRENGLYLYDGMRATPFETDVDAFVKEKKLYHGIRLESGDFVLATFRGGLAVIDANGRLKYLFDENSGLQDNSVKHIFEDKQGNLWLSLDSGISKVEYKSPFSIFDKRSKLPGSVLAVTWHGSPRCLYAGTSRGLYAFSFPFKQFQLVPGMSGYCWSLLSIGDSLLAATSNGVFQLKNNERREIIKNYSYALHRSNKDNKRFWVGINNGLVSLYLKNGQWEKEREFKKIEGQVRTIVENKKGSLWLGTVAKGVLKVDFPKDGEITNYKVTGYDSSKGLPDGWVYVFMAADHVIFATDKGIYQFDEKSGSFFPDFTLGEEFAGHPDGKSVFHITQDKNQYIWFNSDDKNYQASPHQANNTFAIYKKPFLRVPPAHINIIYPDPDGDTIWFGGDDGLVRYDKTVKKDYDLDFQTFIRRVVANENLIFDGYTSQPEVDTKSKGMPPFPIIDYKDRNLRFECAAPSFEAEKENHFRYFLEGYDNNWSGWTSEPQKEYTNLDSGLYTFRVQAVNIYRHPGNEAVFKFKVLPPWFKTWWAFLFYVIISLLLVVSIVRWRSGKLEREKQKLERTVKERTREIEEKSKQLEKQTIQLKEQSEKLKEIDKVKSRFFANISHEFRTPLTLIMGPLEQMLSANRDSERQKTLNLMLRNSQRLLGLINQLLELSKFDSDKIKLQACRQNIVPFLKGIVASFESIAGKNELDLTSCAKKENITLYFDPEKLEEIVFNLLANAVKFTPAGGMVTVTVNTTETRPGEEDFPSGSLDISIGDTGPGIPRDQLAHIFDRFYQSDSTFEHHQKGSGIGLAIAKELVELHQGRIDVHSHEGKGTEFIIRLPMGKAHLKPEEIVEISTPPSPRKTPAEIPGLYMNGGENVEPEPEAMDTDNREISLTGKDIVLVVEDSADVREYIKGSLETHYHVVEARGGQEGIRKAQEIIPDLIISDVMMPETDGYKLCRQLKNNVITSHVPVILLTAKASEENIIRGLETGADDYITKPFNTRILCARIKNLIDLRRHIQETLNREMTLQPAKISVSQIDKRFLTKLKEAIEKNIADTEFNIDQLCRILDMSQPTLYRKIHALTGESPTDFIRTCRLKRGAELLKDNFGSVLEVAFEVGFSSASYFTKCFKKKFHQLPSTYKESEG
jgi:signal transduction histidine kinase/DNA-binding response OmpR family regulator